MAEDKFGKEIKPGDIVAYGAGRGKIQVGIVVDVRGEKVGVRGTGRWSADYLNDLGWLQMTQLTAIVIDRNTVSQKYLDLFATVEIKSK